VDWARQASTIRPTALRPVTMAEVRQHASEHSCWMVIRNMVYDVTAYLRYHPAGINEIMRGAGDDATLLFQEYHAWVNIASMLKSCLIGPLHTENITVPTIDASDWLNESAWTQCTLEHIRKISADSHLLRLTGPTPFRFAKIKAVWHIKLLVLHEASKRVLERPYTPLILHSSDQASDSVDLVVKEYSNRRLTSWLLTHSPSVQVKVQYKPCSVKWTGASKLGLVCNGTGIMPMFQIISQAWNEGIDEIWLVWVNRELANAFLLEEIELIQKSELRNLHVLHLLSSASISQAEMSGDKIIGRFDPEFVAAHAHILPSVERAAAGDARVFLCGSWEFVANARTCLFLSGYPPSCLDKIS